MDAVSLALIGAAYLLGSVPFGLLLARLLGGVDVRRAGSGNIGATNVARTAGRAAGILTLVLDLAKGAAAPALALYVLQLPLWVGLLAGLAAILGHVFPLYLRFRGGKGVATAAGVFLAVTPLATAVAFGVFLLAFGIVRIVSVGSLAAAVTLVAATWSLDGRTPVVAVAAAVAVLVVLRHAGNIRRLVREEEPRM